MSKDDAHEEVIEVAFDLHDKTGFPKPLKRYNLSWEVFDLSLEEPYFWVLDVLKQFYPRIDKVEDSFAAAENSAFFGVTQQRLGAQQDKVGQYLAQTGKMIKELFQMVREIRIIEERLGYYEEVENEVQKPLNERKKGAEITLKGFFVDLVQGGGKSPASVYGMSRELEFITLPDLFFDAPPFKNTDELEGYTEKLKENFNQNVLRVLARHLRQYWEWRVRTHKEHKDRKTFMLQYLVQHYEIIRMYIEWLKPYLKHTQRLTLKEGHMASPDMVSAFEGSRLDVELMAIRRDEKRKGTNGIILATFNYRTRPELKVVQEGYQRGPVHIGKFEMFLRAYIWTDQEVESYKKMKEQEGFDLMGDVSESVKQAMESLGDELKRYVNLAKGIEEKKKQEAAPGKKTLTERWFGDFLPEKRQKEEKKEEKPLHLTDQQREAAAFGVRLGAWNTFQNFKKAHKLIAW